MKLVTVQEMKQIESASDSAGLGYAEMMDRAGKAVAAQILGSVGPSNPSILVLVGPGNNGGDGLVAVRELCREGCAVIAYLWRRNETASDERLNEAVAAGARLQRHNSDTALNALNEALAQCDVVVDALLGTGARGPLRDGAGEILSAVASAVATRRRVTPPAVMPLGATTESGAPAQSPLIIAVDVPSGLDADSGEIDDRALRADLCVTFAYPKRGQFRFPGAAWVGKLLVTGIGTAPALASQIDTSVVTDDDVAARLPARPLDAHKGTFGRVLVVAGSINFCGAPALAARAAYRSGAGLVTLAVPAPIQPALASLIPEATFLPLPNDLGVLAPQAVPLLAERLASYDVLLIGPGITQEEPTREFVRTLLEKHTGGARAPLGFMAPRAGQHSTYVLPPTVIDADGLNLLARTASWWELLPERTVLTPHPLEMARLLGSAPLAEEKDRLVLARAAAIKWGCTVVLKGAYTVVATPGRETEVIPFAEPTLATAGTGDVLAGAVASLMAQGLSCHDAAVCGAYLHGRAGASWAAAHGHAGMLASELADLLPAALKAVNAGK
jgi:hydroxyethylthiazole kinase-like uncharacterized protein yjeF